MNSKEEKQLIVDVLAGDEGAKTRLVAEHRQKLYRVCVHCLGYQDSEAEDALQETFMAAFEGLIRFEGRSSLNTWLSNICANRCFLRLRKRKRMLVVQSEDLERALEPQAQDVHRRSEESDKTQRRLVVLRECVEQLAQPCREIVKLRDVDGTDYVEIGKRLMLPLGTVMSRLSRCRETLKELVLKKAGEMKP
jgi:RNA polymerase sigma-70 factor (ECF subfamily)